VAGREESQMCVLGQCSCHWSCWKSGNAILPLLGSVFSTPERLIVKSPQWHGRHPYFHPGFPGKERGAVKDVETCA
jgi:hypothetical protein